MKQHGGMKELQEEQVVEGGASNASSKRLQIATATDFPLQAVSMLEQHMYLQVVGEPEETGVGVLHSEEHIASRYDAALWDGFDPDRKTAIMFLTHTHTQHSCLRRKFEFW